MALHHYAIRMPSRLWPVSADGTRLRYQRSQQLPHRQLHHENLELATDFHLAPAPIGTLPIPVILAGKRSPAHFLHSTVLQTQNPMAAASKGKIVGGNKRGELVVAM